MRAASSPCAPAGGAGPGLGGLQRGQGGGEERGAAATSWPVGKSRLALLSGPVCIFAAKAIIKGSAEECLCVLVHAEGLFPQPVLQTATGPRCPGTVGCAALLVPPRQHISYDRNSPWGCTEVLRVLKLFSSQRFSAVFVLPQSTFLTWGPCLAVPRTPWCKCEVLRTPVRRGLSRQLFCTARSHVCSLSGGSLSALTGFKDFLWLLSFSGAHGARGWGQRELTAPGGGTGARSSPRGTGRNFLCAAQSRGWPLCFSNHFSVEMT